MDSCVILNGKRYLIRRVPNLGPYLGHCDPPDAKNKEIRIQAGLPLKEDLDTLIHELLHSMAFDMSEEWVNETASSITRVLLKQYLIQKRKR